MNPLSYIDVDNLYPESDGQPMAENTEQYDWLVKIKENLEVLFASDPNVFIAADLLWYPVADRHETEPVAPDVMIVFGRPKGYRGSYKQWEEDNIPPQVVFEILSPSNTARAMEEKRCFYERYGVEEYYVYNPASNKLRIWLRLQDKLQNTSYIGQWISPLLQIRFMVTKDTLKLFYPDGQPFLTSVELAQYARQEHDRAEYEYERAEQERQRAERLAKRLRELGIDPDI